MSQPVISVENLSKSYQLGVIGTGTFYGDVKRWWAKQRGKPDPYLKVGEADHGNRDGETIWALKDVNLSAQQGEALGIIGRNGAGKSTLLKIFSQVTSPTSGVVKVKGRIASLLEVGTGFHPELTGRENIYLNGAIMGMNHDEISRKFDEIVDFSGVERFIDTPVKRYSSGMYVRLAFAVAAHLEPEILVLDEVLAVGDAQFQKKCLGKMQEVGREGRTVLFVSHNMAAIEALCQSACLLDQGCLVMNDKTPQVIQRYLSSLQLLGGHPLGQRGDRDGNGKLRFTGITFCTANGSPAHAVQCGQDLEISVAYKGYEDTFHRVAMSIGVYTLTGQCMLILSNEMVGTEFDLVPSCGQFSCLVKRLPLTPGQYYLNLYCTVNGVLADWVQQAAHLMVEAGDFFGTGRLPPQTHGGILVAQDWRVKDMQGETWLGRLP
jgi:lipopolysaccharide transport system ATP-binding protein